MKLYKYTRFDIGKSIIETFRIALSKPEDFNDPFDCIPVYDEQELTRAIDILNGYVIIDLLQSLKIESPKRRERIIASVVLKEFGLMRRLIKMKPAFMSRMVVLRSSNE